MCVNSEARDKHWSGAVYKRLAGWHSAPLIAGQYAPRRSVLFALAVKPIICVNTLSNLIHKGHNARSLDWLDDKIDVKVSSVQ